MRAGSPGATKNRKKTKALSDQDPQAEQDAAGEKADHGFAAPLVFCQAARGARAFRIERVAQTVAQYIEGQRGEQQRRARHEHHPPCDQIQ
jgi:hypothetical protein